MGTSTDITPGWRSSDGVEVRDVGGKSLLGGGVKIQLG